MRDDCLTFLAVNQILEKVSSNSFSNTANHNNSNISIENGDNDDGSEGMINLFFVILITLKSRKVKTVSLIENECIAFISFLHLRLVEICVGLSLQQSSWFRWLPFSFAFTDISRRCISSILPKRKTLFKKSLIEQIKKMIRSLRLSLSPSNISLGKHYVVLASAFVYEFE